MQVSKRELLKMGASSVKHVHVLWRSIEELREYEAGLCIPDLDEGQSVLEHVWLSPLGGMLIHSRTHTVTVLMYVCVSTLWSCNNMLSYRAHSYCLSLNQLFHTVPLSSLMQVMKLPFSKL